MSFDTVFASPMGRTARSPFIAALLVLLAVTAFYFFLVKGRNGEWVLATLNIPYILLLARRLHDMGQTAWLLLAPGALLAATAWLRFYVADSPLGAPVSVTALVVAAGFALWGVLGKGQAGTNRFGAPAAA
jgi:uncharacterized membrane protein YhaH (DUF805 family)